MDVIQIGIHIHGKFLLQAAQGGAVLPVKPVADLADFLRGKAHFLQQELVDPDSDPIPDAIVLGIEGIIEVKQQAANVVKKHVLAVFSKCCYLIGLFVSSR